MPDVERRPPALALELRALHVERAHHVLYEALVEADEVHDEAPDSGGRLLQEAPELLAVVHAVARPVREIGVPLERVGRLATVDHGHSLAVLEQMLDHPTSHKLGAA